MPHMLTLSPSAVLSPGFGESVRIHRGVGNVRVSGGLTVWVPCALLRLVLIGVRSMRAGLSTS